MKMSGWMLRRNFIHADPIFFTPILQIIFEVPSNLMLKFIGPSKWISMVMMAWGVVSNTSIQSIIC